jgi:ribonuclease HI
LTTVVYIDGRAEGNPGRGAFAYVVYRDGKKLAEDGGFAGDDVTNNYAEYCALVAALERMRVLGADDDITVKSDSKLLVGQMSRGWKVKGGGYVEKYREARDLVREFGSLHFEWIPREENQEADLLTRIASSRRA